MEESVGSNSTEMAAEVETQHVADRIVRALQHNLRLLFRAETSFFVLGATGNVYTVELGATPTCSCPDRASPCKHILFVLLRVLAMPLDEACVWRQTLDPSVIAQLARSPTASGVLAGRRARRRFRELYAAGDRRANQDRDGAICPVCLNEMTADGGAVSTCSTCGNSLHSECLAMWKRSQRGRAATCVVCRARWRERREQRYINLASYMNDADEADADADESVPAKQN